MSHRTNWQMRQYHKLSDFGNCLINVPHFEGLSLEAGLTWSMTRKIVEVSIDMINKRTTNLLGLPHGAWHAIRTTALPSQSCSFLVRLRLRCGRFICRQCGRVNGVVVAWVAVGSLSPLIDWLICLWLIWIHQKLLNTSLEPVFYARTAQKKKYSFEQLSEKQMIEYNRANIGWKILPSALS